MQSILNIVRERLKAGAVVSDHPDPDLLTAFVEKSLPANECGAVTEHLALCGECRDVLALALPAAEGIETALIPARSHWLAWPALRWGFALVGIVVIGMFGVLEFRHQPMQRVLRQNIPEQVAMEAKESGGNGISPAAQPQVSSATHPHSEPGKILMKPKIEGRNWPAGDVVHKREIPASNTTEHRQQQVKQEENGIRARELMPQPATNGQAADSAARMYASKNAQTGTVETNAAVPVNEMQSQQAQAAGQPTAQLSDEDAVARFGKAKPPVPAGGIGGLVLADSRSVPRWSINSTGGLQRSFDEGKSWQDVDVTASLKLGFPPPNQYPIKNQTSEDKTAAEEKDKKRGTITPVFRALALTGADIWAGGVGGALYHSADAGSHWMRVVPSSDGIVLSSDIVSLEFVDAQHGKITTTTAEIWITRDHGETWQRQ